jgi:hypothetical protein
MFEFYVPVPDTGGGIFTVSANFSGTHTTDSLQKAFQDSFDEGSIGLLEHNKKERKRHRSETKEIKSNYRKICIEKG